MLKYMILVALIVSLFNVALPADEIDDKMFQLRQIEKQIDDFQQKARRAEQQKKKAQREIQTSRKMKSAADIRAAKMRQKEAIAQDSLAAANLRVRTNEEKIADLKLLANKEFLRLFLIDRQDSHSASETKDKHLLSILIRLTAKGISDLSEYHKKLILEQEEHRREYLITRRSKVREVRKSEQYRRKIRSLTQRASKLEKDKQAFDRQVSKLKKDATELEALIRKLAAQSERLPSAYQFTVKSVPWPVKGKIIREFGKESRGNNTSVINNGIDIAVPEGTGVKVVGDGEVVFSDRYGGQGKLLIIDHKNGYFSVYAYNSELLVSRGASVKRGQVIAKSGKTGSAVQPSLRFELRKHGRAVNPLNYLK